MTKKYWNEEIETLPLNNLRKLQLKSLQEHLEFAYQHSPYYGASFRKHGVLPSDLKSLEDLYRFPFIDKKLSVTVRSRLRYWVIWLLLKRRMWYLFQHRADQLVFRH